MSIHWDNRYAQTEWAYGREPNDFLAEVTADLPRGRALCLAEGQGRNGVHLARHGFDVTAVDQSPVGLARAHELAGAGGVTIQTQVADLLTYTIEPNAWDLILSVWVHLLPDDRARLHTMCVNGLRPGGRLVLEAYSPAQIGRGTGGPSDPARTMAVDDLRRELSGLDFDILRGCERDVVEGPYHTGLASVTQVLARKPVE